MIRHTISLPEPMSHYIEGRIAEGQYGNVSEYFRDLVRRDQERRQNAIQELRALIKGAELATPLVEEVAADIFIGKFSDKFLAAAKKAGDLLDGSLYAKYYGIDYAQVRSISDSKTKKPEKKFWFWQKVKPEPQVESERGDFAQFCASRAGVAIGTWDPATNGMIIEGNWAKSAPDAISVYTDKAGTPVKLTPGRTWVELVPIGGGTITG